LNISIVNIYKKILLVLFSLFFVLLIIEFCAYFYIKIVIKKPRIYKGDPVLGYVVKPNLNVVRNNYNKIRYITNIEGERISEVDDPHKPANWGKDALKKILIIGDSFAEGTVNIEYRLDKIIQELRNEWSVRAFGAGGYGTDQQLILGRKYFDGLNEGDIFILLTCGNDFFDILREYNFGRAKPLLELKNDNIIEHPPRLDILSKLRELSYLGNYIASKLRPNRYNFSISELQKSKEIYYKFVLEETKQLRNRGVIFIIAYHSDWIADLYVEGGSTNDVFEKLALINSVKTLSLDKHINISNSEYFLNDNFHWNERGYKRVSSVLVDFIEGN